jgi:hypothetical protein
MKSKNPPVTPRALTITFIILALITVVAFAARRKLTTWLTVAALSAPMWSVGTELGGNKFQHKFQSLIKINDLLGLRVLLELSLPR